MFQYTKNYDFSAWLKSRNLILLPTSIETLWLNITRLCNQSCRHCHLTASPETPQHMSEAVMNACLSVIQNNDAIRSVDITGGAPELHPRFEYLVRSIAALGKNITVRHNLTVTVDGHPLTGESKNHLPRLFADNRVELLASLPSWDKEAADHIRGRDVFEKSIISLRRLNTAGYGHCPELVLKLVTNHDGPLTETERANMEGQFKEILGGYGIIFNELLTVTNMPAGRYASELRRTGDYDDYMEALVCASGDSAIKAAVCRSLISVGMDGRLYDCDFNHALDLGLNRDSPQTVFQFDHDRLLSRSITFASHCFGCSAGAGSG
ncbi:MAG: arsenosugar biosynthesis radical SAM (seleno)protein ArsS [Dehalogenimonas sp.]